IPTATALRDFAGTDAVGPISLSPDGTKLAGGGNDGKVKVWNTADGKVLFDMAGHAGPVTGVSFSANNQIIASCGADRTVKFWNPATGQLMGSVGAPAAAARGVLMTPNNAAAYSIGEDGTIKFWTVPTAAPKPLPPAADQVTAVGFLPDGNTVFAAGA